MSKKTMRLCSLCAALAIALAIAPAWAQQSQQTQEQTQQQPQQAAPQPGQPAAAPGAVPDDQRLLQIVKLVQAGLSEALIAEQVRSSGAVYSLTVNDLIYLKEQKVPESIIAALLASRGGEAAPATNAPMAPGMAKPAPTPTPTPEPPKETVVSGLVYATGGFLKKNHSGSLALVEDRLEWRDGSDSSANFQMFVAGIKQVTVKCQARTDAPFCFQVDVDMLKGDDFSFTDAKQDVGGNESIKELVSTLKEHFPKLPVTEKIKK